MVEKTSVPQIELVHCIERECTVHTLACVWFEFLFVDSNCNICRPFWETHDYNCLFLFFVGVFASDLLVWLKWHWCVGRPMVLPPLPLCHQQPASMRFPVKVHQTVATMEAVPSDAAWSVSLSRGDLLAGMSVKALEVDQQSDGEVSSDGEVDQEFNLHWVCCYFACCILSVSISFAIYEVNNASLNRGCPTNIFTSDGIVFLAVMFICALR